MAYIPPLRHKLSTGNTTAALLTAGEEFIGVWESNVDYTTSGVSIAASLSTDGTLFVEVGSDGVTVETSIPYNILDASFDLPKIWNNIEPFFRIRYVNGSTAQTGFFSIITKYSNGQELGLIHSMGDTINSQVTGQVVKAVGTGTDPNGEYSNIVASGVDDNNSSVVALGIGAEFTGEWTDISGYAGITTLVQGTAASVAEGVLYREFSDDASLVLRSIPVDVVDITSASPRHLGKVSKYWRVRYVNGATALTTFNLHSTLNTVMIDLVSRLDQSLAYNEDVRNVRAVIAGINPSGEFGNVNITSANNLASSILDSRTGAQTIVDYNGALKVAEPIVLCGDVMYGQDLSDFLWSTFEINGGSKSAGVGEQLLNTGTTANGGCILQTKKRARFMMAQFNISHFGFQLNPTMLTDPNVIVEWGVVDFIDDTVSPSVENTAANGIFFRVQGHATDPIWDIVTIKNGVETIDAFSDWTGVGLANFNPSPNLFVTEMQYNAGTSFWFQNNFLLHQVKRSSTYAGIYHFPAAFRIRNVNGSTNAVSVGTRAMGIYRLGEERAEVITRAVTSDVLMKTGAGYVQNVYLSRNGSGGGAGKLEVFDGIDNTGVSMAVIDIGGDGGRGIPTKGTFSIGLYIELTGSGTNTATITFE